MMRNVWEGMEVGCVGLVARWYTSKQQASSFGVSPGPRRDTDRYYDTREACAVTRWAPNETVLVRKAR